MNPALLLLHLAMMPALICTYWQLPVPIEYIFDTPVTGGGSTYQAIAAELNGPVQPSAQG